MLGDLLMGAWLLLSCRVDDRLMQKETKNLVGLTLDDLLVLNFMKSTDRMINWEVSTSFYSPNVALQIAAESLPNLSVDAQEETGLSMIT